MITQQTCSSNIEISLVTYVRLKERRRLIRKWRDHWKKLKDKIRAEFFYDPTRDDLEIIELTKAYNNNIQANH